MGNALILRRLTHHIPPPHLSTSYSEVLFMQRSVFLDQFRRLERNVINAGFLLIISAIALLSACGGGGSGGQTTGNQNAPVTNKLSGKVVDNSGVPIPGVTVS